MATYPGAVKSFTTKNAGDTIQPSHINDLQDEVTAIEDGLLNGTAPLNSSRITAPAMQVANGSTLNTLSVSGGSTFAVRPVVPPPEMALVFLTSSGALGSSAASTLAWLGETFVSNSSMHSTSVNPERLIPQSTGMYRFTLQVNTAGAVSTAGWLQGTILDSSGGLIGAHRFYLSTITAHVAQVVGYKRFDALGGYAVVTVGAAALSTLSLSSGAGTTWFAMEKC